jgi:hypothetical protein
MPDTNKTPQDPSKFDFSVYPADTLFYDRRSGLEGRDRRAPSLPVLVPVPVVEVVPKLTPERRKRKERRRRIDPTTFEKQYTEEEMEFMTAMQQFKNQSGKSFPSHGDILRIAARLGYRKSFLIDDFDDEEAPTLEAMPCLPI